jgi:hypothetical protein
VSRRASLPGAEELFRRTGAERARAGRAEPAPSPQEDKSTKLQVAAPPERPAAVRKAPKHDEKITFYCTSEDLMTLEGARLKLRSQQGIAADRGRIVRAALGYVLEDFDARGEDSVLVRYLEAEE